MTDLGAALGFCALVCVVYCALSAMGEASERLACDPCFWLGWSTMAASWVGFVAAGFVPWLD